MKTNTLTLPLRRRRWAGRAGFNMVEVMLAVAFVGLSMAVIIGLLPAGTDASRRATDDTILGTIAADILDGWRIAPYGQNNPILGGAPLTTAGATQWLYDAHGVPVASGNLSTTNAYFLVTTTVTFGSLDPGYPQLSSVTSPDSAHVTVAVQWPLLPLSSITLAPNYQSRVYFGQYARTSWSQ